MKHGAPWLCQWKKRSDGRYDVTMQSDTSPLKAVAKLEGDNLIYSFSDNSKPVTLSRDAH